MQMKRATISVNEQVNADLKNLIERLFTATGVEFSTNQALEYLLAYEQGRVNRVTPNLSFGFDK